MRKSSSCDQKFKLREPATKFHIFCQITVADDFRTSHSAQTGITSSWKVESAEAADSYRKKQKQKLPLYKLSFFYSFFFNVQIKIIPLLYK